jgi:hypothetical protein
MNDKNIKSSTGILNNSVLNNEVVESAELIKLLKTNIAKSEEILGKIKYIKKYIFWQQVGSVVRILIILIPIVIGFIYLPPLIRDSLGSYQELLRPNSR